MVQLRTDDMKVVWQGKSAIDLQKPFSDTSTGDDTTSTTDTFTLSTNLAPGIYHVCVQINDPAHVYASLALANTGRTQDGAYCLGVVTVCMGAAPVQDTDIVWQQSKSLRSHRFCGYC